jgi:Cu/Zn superoxide dismutase
LDSHGKLLRYDSLTGEEVDKMQVNTMALGTFATQAGNLDPPRKYSKQYKVFHLAVDELRDATELAHTLAADPISATQADFDDYDRLVDEAAAGLQQSNKILGKDYKTMKGVRSASTS